MSGANKPIHPQSRELRRDDQRPTHSYAPGMTLLEHYAGLAMQGLLSNSNLKADASFEALARNSVAAARALIAELENQP